MLASPVDDVFVLVSSYICHYVRLRSDVWYPLVSGSLMTK
jgi:hypothetical protein